MRKFSFVATMAAAAIGARILLVQAQPYGPGMMGGGYGGPGWMHGGYGMGPGMMYGGGYGNEGNLNLTVDRVKTYLQQMIRNPNLKVGDVKEKDADTIVAEIVTKQGNSIVQKLDFNRHNGFVQPEQ